MKFKVIGDEANQPRYSSHIIIDSLNREARKLELYDEKGKVIFYDGVADSHGTNPDAFITTYEITFPWVVLNNAKGKLLIGVSSDNQSFMIEGGHDPELTAWFSLGVDSKLYPEVKKTRNLDKFVVGCYTESLIRGGVNSTIEAFGRAFSGRKDVKLCLKDRNGTETFEKWVKKQANFFNVEIEYLNCHFATIEEIVNWFSGIDCHLYLNYSSTFALPPLEGLSMGIPTIAMSYSGPRHYIINGETGLTPKYTLKPIEEDFQTLQKIGTRNYFFLGGYKKTPTWAIPDLDDTARCLLEMESNKELRLLLKENGRKMAESLTWEKSVKQLDSIIKQKLS